MATQRLGTRHQGTGGGTFDFTTLLQDFKQKEADALAANKAREDQINQTYADLIARSSEGGFMKEAGLADIEKAKTQAIGSGMQQLISSGMYGTTTAASLPMRAEADASTSRLKLEDMLEQRTMGLRERQAGFTERISDPYPDYGMLMQAAMAQNSQPSYQPLPTYGGGGGGTSQPSIFGQGPSASTLKEQARYTGASSSSGSGPDYISKVYTPSGTTSFSPYQAPNRQLTYQEQVLKKKA